MASEISFAELASDRTVLDMAGVGTKRPSPSAEISFADIETPGASGAEIPLADVGEVDTFYSRSKDELFNDDKFDPRQYYAQNPDVARQPAQLQKLLEVYRGRRERGVTLGAAKEAAKSAIPTAGKFAKGAYTLASNVFEFSGLQPLFNKAASVVTGDAFDAKRSEALDTESENRARKAYSEFQAGTELSATGIADLGRTGVRKIFGKAPKDQTDQELLQDLAADVEFANQLRAVGEGRGESLKAAGIDADTLAKDGITLDSEAIENLSLVDPATVIATAGLFKVVGAGGKVLATAGTRQAAAKAAAALNSAAQQIAGKTIQGAGIVAQKGAAAVGAVAQKVPGKALGAAIGGVKTGSITGVAVGAAAGEAAKRVVVETAEQAAKAGGRVAEFGREIAGEIPRSAALDRVYRLVGSAPVKGTVLGATVGTAAAVPLALATDDDVAAGGILGGGLALGGAAGLGIGAKTAIGEGIARRTFDPHGVQLPVVDSPAYGIDAALDTVHEAKLKTLSPAEQGTVTSFREAVRALGGEIYAVDKNTFKQQIQNEASRNKPGGTLTPEEIAAIDQFADHQGFFDASVPAPDGSLRRVVFLNGDAAAVPHEAGHLFHSLLAPSIQDSLVASVREFYTPEQIQNFKGYYERRLGAPVTEEAAIRELVAENFSAIFNNVPITELTAPKGFLSKLGDVAVQAAETLGIDLTGGRTTPDLKAPVSHRVRSAFENAARQLAAANEASRAAVSAPAPVPTPAPPSPTTPFVPVIVPPTPAAPVPVPASPTAPARNIRVTPKQQADFAAKRAAETGIVEARETAAKDTDPNVTARVNEVSASMESGNPVLEIEHLGIKSAGTPAAPEGRTARRGTQASGYEQLEALRVENRVNAPASVVNTHQKTFVPVRWTNQGGTPTLIAMSLDKVISNVHKIAREAANKGAADLIPYQTEQGRLTEAGWQKVVADAQAYAENQSNGFRGDGQRLTRPTEDVGLSIPAENPNYRPTLLGEPEANFQNLIQGLATPETAREQKGSVPGNIKGQVLAEANKRLLLQPRDIKPKNVGKQQFASFPGRSLKEVNPLRNQMVERGVPVRELIEVTERIRAKDIASIRPRPEINFKAPVTDIIRGGFLPVDSYAAQIAGSTSEEFSAMSKSWKGGLTGEAWRLGRGVESQADVATLKRFQEQQSVKARAFMAAKNYEAASPEVMKGQFFREAWEAATGEGSAGSSLPKIDPTYKPPFPTTPASGGNFLPAPSEPIRELAKSYSEASGIEYRPRQSYAQVNEALGVKLADFYEKAKSDPANPEVSASYKALADETLSQLQAIRDAGYTLELYTGDGEPYSSSADAITDVRDNQHLFVLPTEGNFAGGTNNPLLAPSGVEGLPTVNDVFRGVHDFFGHAKEGYQFGPRGEFNAWRAHSEMYSPAAQGALAAETLAQNSWVNFGPQVRGRDIPARERPFAEQKAVVVPAGLIEEARGQFLPEEAGGRPSYIRQDLFDQLDQSTRQMVSTRGVTQQFWVSKSGDIIPAQAGHQAWAEDFLSANHPEIYKNLDTKGGDDLSVIYEAMDSLGFSRGIRGEGTAIELNGPKGVLSRSAVKSLQALAEDKGYRIVRHGQTVAERSQPSDEGGAFLPRTESGRILEDTGFIIKPFGGVGNRGVEVFDADRTLVGEISSAQRGKDLSEISFVKVNKDYRGEGIGEALYRELADQLKADGVKTVTGAVVAPQPLAIRRKVFGDFKEIKLNGEPATFEQAIGAAARIAETAKPKPGQTSEVAAIEPVNEITADSQFLPRVKRNDEGQPLTKDGLVDYERLYKELTAARKRGEQPDAGDDNTEKLRESAGLTPFEQRAAEREATESAALAAAIKTVRPTKTDERLALYHFTRLDALTETDPKKQSSKVNPFWSSESPKTFFLSEGAERNPGADYAQQFANKTVFRGEIDPGQLYDARETDPLRIFSTANRVDAEQRLLDAGFSGARMALKSGNGSVVVLFEPLKVKKVGRSDETGGLVSGKFLPRVNIGLNVDGKPGSITQADVLRALEDAGVEVLKSSTVQSDTEATVVADLSRPLTPSEAATVSQKLKQEAIAQFAGGKGELYGPSADKWRPFNPDYFLNHEGEPRMGADEGGQFLPAEQPFRGFEDASPEELAANRVRSKVSKVKANNPEALLPQYARDEDGALVVKEDGKPRPVSVEYDLVNSPLAKEAAKGLRGAAREEAISDALAKELVSAHKQAVKNPDLEAGSKWYSTARVRLKKLLGDDSKLFAELLGATSARTPVETNFRFAVDAYNRFKAGEYNDILAKYREGKQTWDEADVADFVKATKNDDPTRGQFLDWWVTKYNLSPTQSNGKKFGANSRAVLRVLDGSWATEVKGPKTPNFAGNLTGSTFDATVDVWAARALHRLANKGSERRWRILPENETGVTGADFYLGQSAYRKAAAKLGVKADALQAILWFAEKSHWEKNGWTRGAGAEKSDFNSLLSETEKSPEGKLSRREPQKELELLTEKVDIVSRKKTK